MGKHSPTHSPTQFSENNRVDQLDVFTMDDDAKSLEDGIQIDEREVEERAVVDFVSEIELNHDNIKLRGCCAEEVENVAGDSYKKDVEEEADKDDEEASQ